MVEEDDEGDLLLLLLIAFNIDRGDRGVGVVEGVGAAISQQLLLEPRKSMLGVEQPRRRSSALAPVVVDDLESEYCLASI